MRLTPATLVITALLVSGSATAGEEQGWLDTGWLLFGDLYHVPQHHSEAGDGATGLVLRRGYLTFDADFGEKWFGRLRFELNQSGEFEDYDFELDFKDLYAGRELGRHRLLLGLSPTPTFDLIESVWGLRYLARTPMDLQGLPSRDTGISLSGPLNGTGTVSYRAMVGAGIEFGNESGDGQRWMGALTWRPKTNWMVDLYADHDKLSGPFDRTTLQAFAGYDSDRLRAGVQYSYQDRQNDPPVELASAFVVRPLDSGQTLIARIDHLLEPSPRGDDIDYLPIDPSARATLFFAGVEFRFGPHIALTPNTVVISYDRNDEGFRPETDVHLRLTLFVDFE